MKLKTRREIVEIWLKYQNRKNLDKFCCPSCRDLLFKKGDNYFCKNENCGDRGILIKDD